MHLQSALGPVVQVNARGRSRATKATLTKSLHSVIEVVFANPGCARCLIVCTHQIANLSKGGGKVNCMWSQRRNFKCFGGPVRRFLAGVDWAF